MWKDSPPPLTLPIPPLSYCTVHLFSVEPVADPDVVFPVDFNGISYQVRKRKRRRMAAYDPNYDDDDEDDCYYDYFIYFPLRSVVPYRTATTTTTAAIPPTTPLPLPSR